jgi:hypothetical protein
VGWRMKLRFTYIDLSPEEAVDLGNVRIIKVLDHWNTPRGQAVKREAKSRREGRGEGWGGG